MLVKTETDTLKTPAQSIVCQLLDHYRKILNVAVSSPHP